MTVEVAVFVGLFALEAAEYFCRQCQDYASHGEHSRSKTHFQEVLSEHSRFGQPKDHIYIYTLFPSTIWISSSVRP